MATNQDLQLDAESCEEHKQRRWYKPTSPGFIAVAFWTSDRLLQTLSFRFPVPSSAITTLSGSPIDPAYSAPYKRGFIVGDAGGSLLSVQQQGFFQKSYTTSQFAAGVRKP
jgi:hypothetical protein